MFNQLRNLQPKHKFKDTSQRRLKLNFQEMKIITNKLKLKL